MVSLGYHLLPISSSKSSWLIVSFHSYLVTEETFGIRFLRLSKFNIAVGYLSSQKILRSHFHLSVIIHQSVISVDYTIAQSTPWLIRGHGEWLIMVSCGWIQPSKDVGPHQRPRTGCADRPSVVHKPLHDVHVSVVSPEARALRMSILGKRLRMAIKSSHSVLVSEV